MRVSKMVLVRRGFAAAKRGTFTHPLSFPSSSFHDLSHKNRPFSSKPRIDFSCIHQIDDAVFSFREMLRMRPQPRVVEFNKLLTSIVKMKKYSFALNVFDELRQSGARVDDYTLTIVINCYCLLNRVDFGFAILGSFFKCGYEPNVTTFTTLIKGLLLDDKLDTLTAYDLLGLFEKTSFKPGVKSYSVVIDSLCKDRMVDDALQLLVKMIDKGISPDTVTYSSVVQGLCNFGRWKDAKDLITEMVDQGFETQLGPAGPTVRTGNRSLGWVGRALKTVQGSKPEGIKRTGGPGGSTARTVDPVADQQNRPGPLFYINS
ncbi:UNVERIFIED_CONTAM: putative pentatricopeptide repeat-containing protein, mitochondrial [Sesamum radiatum]|uniref:Pentatricopeptide repeat-containing protein, mitochondrial n=1 Tax=Sesamum radiatum TaxID=300843 RepID=A0AAW2VRX3_SESRA